MMHQSHPPQRREPPTPVVDACGQILVEAVASGLDVLQAAGDIAGTAGKHLGDAAGTAASVAGDVAGTAVEAVVDGVSSLTP